jgi:hypothetical protein
MALDSQNRRVFLYRPSRTEPELAELTSMLDTSYSDKNLSMLVQILRQRSKTVNNSNNNSTSQSEPQERLECVLYEPWATHAQTRQDRRRRVVKFAKQNNHMVACDTEGKVWMAGVGAEYNQVTDTQFRLVESLWTARRFIVGMQW